MIFKGANRHIKDVKERTPYRLAIEKQKTSIAEMLESDSQSVNNCCNFFVLRTGITKAEKSYFNLYFFLLIHLFSESAVFLLIIPCKIILIK